MRDLLDEPPVILSGSTRIPVRNLWLLMLYASELFAEDSRLRAAGVEENPDELVDLVSEVLVTEVERRLRRPLSRRHRHHREDLTRVRGAIDHLRTASRGLLARGQVACRFDDLTVDHLVNRVLATALGVVERQGTKPGLRERASAARRTLGWSGVSLRPVSLVQANAVVLGRNDEAERRAVSAARLLLQMNVFTEEAGTERAVEASRDIRGRRKLYERAVRGFYHAVLIDPWTTTLSQPQPRWPLTDPSEGMRSLMPTMQYDTFLTRPGRTIIVETKFTAPTTTRWMSEGQAFKTGHLYQLQSYLSTRSREPGEQLEGVLLYPRIDDAIDMSAQVGPHRLRVKTVDLAVDGRRMREDRLAVVA